MDTNAQFTLAVFLLFVLIEGASAANVKEDCEQVLPDSDTDSRHKERPEFCIRGQHLDVENGVCKPCPFDHYMPDALHAQARCYPCRHARPDSAEIDLVACTDTLDTIIACKEGWFLQGSAYYVGNFHQNLFRCHPCTRCNNTNPPSYEIRQCRTLTDTVCCPNPNMLAVQKDGERAYFCRDPSSSIITTASNEFPGDGKGKNSHEQRIDVMNEKATTEAINKNDVKGLLLCGPGQFLKVSDGNKNDTCEKCPDGWYRPEIRHTNSKCLSRNEKRRLEHDTSSQPITPNFFIGLTFVLSVFMTLFIILAYQCYHRKNKENHGNSVVYSQANSISSPLKKFFRFYPLVGSTVHESPGEGKFKVLIEEV